MLSLLPGGFNYIKSENKLCVEVKIKSRQKLFEELAKKWGEPSSQANNHFLLLDGEVAEQFLH